MNMHALIIQTWSQTFILLINMHYREVILEAWLLMHTFNIVDDFSNCNVHLIIIDTKPLLDFFKWSMKID
jgi:hypothetical protein